MLKVKLIKVGELKANCYLVYDSERKDCLIIDAGDDADYIERQVNDLNLKPIKVIATHGHYDHTLAVFELKTAYKIPFLASSKDEFLLKVSPKSASYFSHIKYSLIPKIDKNLKNNDEVIFGFERLKVIETPGHTPGSLSFYSSESKNVFVGDLFFADGTYGRCDFKYSDKSELELSVKKILGLGKGIKVFCGHGPAFET